jgi:hypothetical protein
MKNIKNIIILFVICAVSCTRFSPEIEAVLQQAGSNRAELEEVLKHYGRDPSDSLKLRAAEFLIANMPGKYSEYYDAPWNDVSTVHLRWTSSSNKQKVLDTYRMGEPLIREDIRHITAKYMINNIDLAFKVWKETPWGKDIPFDAFCEEILPYRVGTEPLENWREKVLASFADLYQSFIKDTVITSVQACSKVNSVLPRFRMDKDFPDMTYTQLMASTRGTCDAMAALAIFAMRGLGIPVTLDFTPKWVELPTGHSWNSVRDSSGKHISFMGCQSNPGASHQGTTLRKYRAYRRFYGKQQNVAGLDEKDIPPLLQNINYIRDVTSETGFGLDLWGLPVFDGYKKENGPVYLAYLNGMEWRPICWSVVTEYRTLEFLSVSNGLYLPVYYQNGVQTPAGCPFRFQYGTCSFYQLSSLRTWSFNSIAPGGYEYLHQMRGGKFEVANCSDFSDARTIHTVETAGLGYRTVSLKRTTAYRYIRFVSPSGGRCNVSILEFYDENGEKLQGSAIGSPGANASMTHDKVFDGDVDTYFEAATDYDPWIGLDLGEACRIAKIRYLPRTGGNAIYEGHVYELFYWNGNEWQSLGQKTADSHILQYKVPNRALLYLKNITKNRMHQAPFVIESYVQQWF